MLNRSVKPGERLSAKTYNELLRAARTSRHVSGGGDATISKTPFGTVSSSARPRRRPVFMIRSTEFGTLIAKDAIIVAGVDGWSVPTGSNHIVGHPFPGYTVSDFAPFFLTDPDKVNPGDRACEYEDGYFIPIGVSGGGGYWGGKIMAVNLHTQIAEVVPMKPTTDPTGSDWLSEDGFDEAGRRCVWIGGFTGLQIAMPVIVFQGSNMPIPWVIGAWNLTGPEFARWGRPLGPFSPTSMQTVPPPPAPPLCDRWACCFDNGKCEDTSLTKCVEREGTYWEGLQCLEVKDVKPECTPKWPCCYPDGQCELTSESLCIGSGGTPRVGIETCDEADCQPLPLGCCCDASNPGLNFGDMTLLECQAIGVEIVWMPCPCSEVDCLSSGCP